ncbi:hypothetical protein NQ358_24130, partial [Escherichia coli]|nr:hypothetical protein [Escherichia coli]
RGRPRLARGTATVLRLAPSPASRGTIAQQEPILAVEPAAAPEGRDASHHHLKVSRETAHWGYLSRAIPPVMSVRSGALVTIETLTQHAFDDY